MTGRHTGVVRVEVDDDAGGDWVEYGRVMLGELKARMGRSGVAVDAVRRYPAPGVAVDALSFHGTDIIRISAVTAGGEPSDEIPLYLESGVSAFTSPGFLHRSDASSATLFRAGPDAAGTSDGGVSDAEPKIGDGRLVRFKASGPDWVRVVNMPESGGFSRAMGDPSLDGAAPDEAAAQDRAARAELLYWKQEAVQRFSPSLFSGKMQYFVQCLYGADNESLWGGISEAGGQVMADWSLDKKEFTFEPDRLKYKGIALRWDWPNTVLLVTGDATLTHYLVWLVHGAARVRKLKPRRAAALLREFMLARRADIEPDEWAKLEGYLLGNSDIGVDLLQTHIFAEYPNIVIGNPFGGYHGWTQTWSGNEARVIVHEVEDVPGTTDQVQFVARECKISIAVNDGSDRAERPLVFALEKVAETPWYYHNSALSLSYYHYFYDWLQYYVFPDPPVNKTFKIIYGNAPVYGYFDDRDRYVIARFFSAPPTVMLPRDIPELDVHMSFCASAAESKYDYEITTFSTSGWRSYGVIVAADGEPPMHDSTKTLGVGTYYLYEYTLAPFGSSSSSQTRGIDNEPAVFGTGACGYSVPPDEDTPSGRYGTWTEDALMYRATMRWSQNSETHFAWALSVPRGDVACVYCGDFDGNTRTVVDDEGTKSMLYGRTFVQDGVGYTYTGHHFIDWQTVIASNQTQIIHGTVHTENMNFYFCDRVKAETLIEKNLIDADYFPLFFPAEDTITHAYDLPFHVAHGLGEDAIYDAPRRQEHFRWHGDYDPAKSVATRAFVGWSRKTKEAAQ